MATFSTVCFLCLAPLSGSFGEGERSDLATSRSATIRQADNRERLAADDWKCQRCNGALCEFARPLTLMRGGEGRQGRADLLEQLYKTSEAPRYVRGHAVTLALLAFAGVVYGMMSFYFTQRNTARREGKEDDKIRGKSELEIAEMGDESPRFIFTR